MNSGEVLFAFDVLSVFFLVLLLLVRQRIAVKKTFAPARSTHTTHELTHSALGSDSCPYKVKPFFFGAGFCCFSRGAKYIYINIYADSVCVCVCVASVAVCFEKEKQNREGHAKKNFLKKLYKYIYLLKEKNNRRQTITCCHYYDVLRKRKVTLWRIRKRRETVMLLNRRRGKPAGIG